VGSWPLFKLKLEDENIGAQQLINFDALAHELCDIIPEKEGAHKVVLVFDDVVNHNSNGSNLVVFHGSVNRI
jgi:hypothetical protein